MAQCRICSSKNIWKFKVKEMMFGTREEFDYFQCNTCGCIQILKYPANISEYYPDNYYSYHINNENNFFKKIKQLRDNHYLGDSSILGKILAALYGMPSFLEWVKSSGTTRDSAILEVGCGSGELLRRMHDVGFNNLLGVDPHIKQDEYISNNFRILKKSIFEINEKFDFVMLHHTLEHLQDQIKTLEKIYKILNDGAKLLIRIPIAGTLAWRKYGSNWVQLDAPRHFYLHTVQSLGHLAEKTGFEIIMVKFDSSEFQFWGSEQYLNDIPLYSEKSYLNNKRNSIITQKLIKKYHMESIKLNEMNDGDQACFFLAKK